MELKQGFGWPSMTSTGRNANLGKAVNSVHRTNYSGRESLKQGRVTIQRRPPTAKSYGGKRGCFGRKIACLTSMRWSDDLPGSSLRYWGAKHGGGSDPNLKT